MLATTVVAQAGRPRRAPPRRADVAAIKGDRRMARSSPARRRPRASGAARCRSCRSTATGCACGGATRAASSSARAPRRGNHNERRPLRRRSVDRPLPAQYRAGTRRGRTATAITVDDVTRSPRSVAARSCAASRSRGVGRRPRRPHAAHPEVRAALERMWPILDGAELVNDLLGFEALDPLRVRRTCSRPTSSGSAPRPGAATCATSRGPTPTSPLLDEADAMLGPRARPPASRRRGRSERGDRDGPAHGRPSSASEHRERRAGARALRRRHARAVGDDDGELRTYGHVLVDEAQDLTAMQWRMLARRCPSGSMTLVGDFGQASRTGRRSRAGTTCSRTSPCGCRRAG